MANVAQNLLEKHDTKALNAAITMLQALRTADPTLTSHEDQHPFVECATFADDIKYNGGGWQSDFHFVDIAYVDEGKASDYNIVTKANNLTVGI